MSDQPSTGVDANSFRRGMRHVPTVVTVLTMADDEGTAGITIGSFVSLSLDPPLICFNVQRSTSIHDRIVRAPSYVVHVLRETQSDLSNRFATPRLSEEEQFRGLNYEVETDGPVLAGALVTFICSAESVLPGGDHSILVGRVMEVREGEPGRPVVFHQRAYWGIGQQVAERPSRSGD
jgi:flavin reductase (DIM6/NTAB) family NADH-FMN oxidoreductase RutF